MIRLQKVLVVVILAGLVAFQFSQDPKKFIVKKWKLNETEMKQKITQIVREQSEKQGMNLTDEQVTGEVGKAWEMLKSMTMEFKSDGTFDSNTAQGQQTGKWTLSEDGKQLTTQREGNPARNFVVRKLTKDELVLENSQSPLPVLAMVPY